MAKINDTNTNKSFLLKHLESLISSTITSKRSRDFYYVTYWIQRMERKLPEPSFPFLPATFTLTGSYIAQVDLRFTVLLNFSCFSLLMQGFLA